MSAKRLCYRVRQDNLTEDESEDFHNGTCYSELNIFLILYSTYFQNEHYH